MQQQEVILVTTEDEPIGTMEKMEAHEKGLLHRAFSVFVFDTEGRMLLQRRAAGKYHGAFLWTNACCSHPRWNEPVKAAAQRRLEEEMGFSTDLKKIFAFTYKADVENGLIEYEYDHVFAGVYDGEININEEEVGEYAYLSVSEIKERLQQSPETFTAWFRIAFQQVEEWWKNEYVVREKA